MRIASLLPAATEIVTSLGAADRLVAVTFECAEEARDHAPVVVDTAIPGGLAPAFPRRRSPRLEGPNRL